MAAILSNQECVNILVMEKINGHVYLKSYALLDRILGYSKTLQKMKEPIITGESNTKTMGANSNCYERHDILHNIDFESVIYYLGVARLNGCTYRWLNHIRQIGKLMNRNTALRYIPHSTNKIES